MIYDISPPISPDFQVWPGDTPVSREVLLDMAKGDNLTLCTLHSTVHAGAHADAPSHYSMNGASIGERSLDFYASLFDTGVGVSPDDPAVTTSP